MWPCRQGRQSRENSESREFSEISKGRCMIRVAVVDDQQIVRAGLTEFLHCQPDIRIVAEGRNGSQAVDLARRCVIDVLVMDLCMPGRNGLDALAAIQALAPELGVLILSGYPEALYAPQLKALGAAFLHKNCQPDEIVRAIRTVAKSREATKTRQPPSAVPKPSENRPTPVEENPCWP